MQTTGAQSVSGSTPDFGSQAVNSTSAPQTINFSIGSGTTVGSIAVLTTGVAVDGAGNVYVADFDNNAVKKIPATAPAKTRRPYPAHAQCVSA